MASNSSKGPSARKTKAQLSEENDSLRRRVRELEQGHQGLEIRKRPDQLSEEMHRIYNEVPIGLCNFDTDLRYQHINDWLAALNGLSVDDHLGRSMGELLPRVAAGVESQLRHVIETGKPILGGTVDTETPAQPGVTRSFQHNYLPIRSDDGAVVGVSCVVEEITERKKTEEASRQSQEQYQGLVETSHDLIWAVDSKGCFTFVNRNGAKSILGYEPEDMIGKSLAFFKTPEQSKKDMKIFEKIKKSGSILNYETAYRANDACLSGYHPHPLYVVCTHFPE